MTELSIADRAVQEGVKQSYALFPFYRDGKPVDQGPRWGMTLKAARSMRFRWNESNENRTTFLQTLSHQPENPLTPVSLELIHSKIVYDLKDGKETYLKTGDGMISQNKKLLPVVTVADCMPLFLFDPETGVFGVFHSGWKGTGIIAEGINLACKNYGSKIENICVAIGPHIHSCCYCVDKERADYFSENFTPKAITKTCEYNSDGKNLYQLSLLEANLAVLEKTGIPFSNIVVARDCTACSSLELCPGSLYHPFGSFRREAAFQSVELTTERKSRLMTVQAAFCGYLS